jgi:hypothetical protein
MTEKLLGYVDETVDLVGRKASDYVRLMALKTFSVYETQTGQVVCLHQHEEKAWLEARDLNDARATAEGLRYSVKRTDKKTEARRVADVKRLQKICTYGWTAGFKGFRAPRKARKAVTS